MQQSQCSCNLGDEENRLKLLSQLGLFSIVAISVHYSYTIILYEYSYNNLILDISGIASSNLAAH